MKKILSVMVLVTFLAATASAMFNISTAGQALLVKANTTSPLEGLGTVVNQTKNMIKCVYDYSVLGSVQTPTGLLDDQGNACVLPVGAIAVRDYLYVVTAFVGPGASVSLSLKSLADLKALTAITALTLAAPLEGALTGAMTLALGATTVASSQPYIWSNGALTAGKLNVYIEYVY